MLINTNTGKVRMRGIRYIVSVTRRDLVRAGAMTAASYSRVLGANDRIRMGYIGIGNRGDQVHEAFLEHGDAQTVAVCDLREDYMEFAARNRAAHRRNTRNIENSSTTRMSMPS